MVVTVLRATRKISLCASKVGIIGKFVVWALGSGQHAASFYMHFAAALRSSFGRITSGVGDHPEVRWF